MARLSWRERHFYADLERQNPKSKRAFTPEHVSADLRYEYSGTWKGAPEWIARFSVAIAETYWRYEKQDLSGGSLPTWISLALWRDPEPLPLKLVRLELEFGCVLFTCAYVEGLGRLMREDVPLLVTVGEGPALRIAKTRRYR